MKLKYAAAVLGLALSTMASADQNGVAFRITLRENAFAVAKTTLTGEFGKELTVEVRQLMKVVAIASLPNSEGQSLITAKLSVFYNGAMQPPNEMSMLADLSKSPSFNYSVPGTGYNFIVTPRSATVPQP
jgi:hypothetical protein